MSLLKDCLNILIKPTEVGNPLETFNHIDIALQREPPSFSILQM